MLCVIKILVFFVVVFFIINYIGMEKFDILYLVGRIIIVIFVFIFICFIVFIIINFLECKIKFGMILLIVLIIGIIFGVIFLMV